MSFASGWTTRCNARLAANINSRHSDSIPVGSLTGETKRTFLRPPAVLKQAGFAAEGEYWEITGALYGLQESPADWASYRDETLPTIEVLYQDKKLHLERSKHEPNMWLLRCPETSALLAVFDLCRRFAAFWHVGGL